MISSAIMGSGLSDDARLLPSFLLLLLIGAFPARADGTLKICNVGTADLGAVVAINEGGRYHVIGWSTINPHACKEVYNSPGGDAALVGLAYHDGHGVVGSLTGLTLNADRGDKAVHFRRVPAVTVCVLYDTFEYYRPSLAALSNCDPGYFKMPFELLYEPVAAADSTYTMTVITERDDPATPMDGTMGWYESFFSKSLPTMLRAAASGFVSLQAGAASGNNGARFWKLKMDRDDVGDCQVLEGSRNSILCQIFKSRNLEGAVKNFLAAQEHAPWGSSGESGKYRNSVVSDSRHSPDGFDLHLFVTQTSDAAVLNFQLVAPAANLISPSSPANARAEVQTALNTAWSAGVADMKQKNYEDAIPLLLRASEIDSKQDVVWATLAGAYAGLAGQKSGSSPEASDLRKKGVDAYKRALALKPEDPGYLNNYALEAGRLNMWPEAQASLEKAAILDPSNAGRYYFNLGALLANGRQNAAAVEAFEKVAAGGEYYAAAQQQIKSLTKSQTSGLSSGLKKGDPVNGKEVFEQCAICHVPQTPQARAVKAPPLNGLFRRDTLRNGKKVTDESVLGLINSGSPGMPAYKGLLTEVEKNDLIAYLKTI